MRRTAVGVALIVGLSVAVLGVSRDVGSVVVADYERQVRVVRNGPSHGCGGDTCTQEVMEPLTIGFSSLGSPVTVVATVSFRYRTTPGDPAEVRLLYREAGTDSYREAQPGAVSLEPSHQGTTTSSSWTIRWLAGATDYEFVIEALGTTHGNFRVTTKNLVFVFEGTS